MLLLAQMIKRGHDYQEMSAQDSHESGERQLPPIGSYPGEHLLWFDGTGEFPGDSIEIVVETSTNRERMNPETTEEDGSLPVTVFGKNSQNVASDEQVQLIGGALSAKEFRDRHGRDIADGADVEERFRDELHMELNMPTGLIEDELVDQMETELGASRDAIVSNNLFALVESKNGEVRIIYRTKVAKSAQQILDCWEAHDNDELEKLWLIEKDDLAAFTQEEGRHTALVGELLQHEAQGGANEW